MPNGCIVSEEIVVGQPVVLGCTDSTAINFDSNANSEDFSCEYVSPCDIVPTGLFVDNVIHILMPINMVIIIIIIYTITVMAMVMKVTIPINLSQPNKFS